MLRSSDEQNFKRKVLCAQHCYNLIRVITNSSALTVAAKASEVAEAAFVVLRPAQENRHYAESRKFTGMRPAHF